PCRGENTRSKCPFKFDHNSKREPVTEEEKLFVAVCRGEREPVTEAERVWSKYMTRIKRPKRFHTLSGGKPQVEGAEDYTDSDD
ncbi:DUF413 domain-containing protein, partial [Escherichia coli]|nr:DUF413 domain-containing protein [Escherichia coli]